SRWHSQPDNTEKNAGLNRDILSLRLHLYVLYIGAKHGNLIFEMKTIKIVYFLYLFNEPDNS
ncbi:hypothetical protein, partial [Siminovitchia terrae]|uniref:hypothetical protein n=1 Tax=Siminovitchia terrae TaxID=1914933 RepID=UPI0028AB1CDF